MYKKIIFLIFYFICLSFVAAIAADNNNLVESKKLDLKEKIVEKTTNRSYFVSCPGNIIETVTDACGKTITWTEPLSNNPNVTEITSSPVSGSFFSLGQTTVLYQGKNSAGIVIETCSFTVTVTLNNPSSFIFPDVQCAPNQSITLLNSCNRTAIWPEPVSPCSEITFTKTASPSITQFNIGTTEVFYRANLDGIEIASCSFTITLIDNIAPTFDFCPTNIVLDADENCEAVANWTTPAASDNCGFAPDLTSNFANGSTFPLGTTTVTYTATDEGGNIATCSFDVTVEDNTGPEFLNIPTEVRVPADASCEAIATWAEITAVDNCSAIIDISSDAISGNLFNLGQTLVTYSAIDQAGNETLASFNVIVEDNTAPSTSNCPNDFTVFANSDCEAIATWNSPSFSDNCDSSPQVSSSHNPGDTFPFGDTEVSYTARDQAGNETICSFIVSVEDNTPPEIISQPTDLIVSANNEACEAAVNWDDVIAADNCDNSVDIVTSFNSGDIFPLGETLVEITAKDAAANETISSFTVTVEDNTAPTVVSCPNDIIFSTTDNCEAVANWTLPVFSDNCDTNPIISSTHNSGDVFSLGTTTVTYTATDDAGNESICTFNVIVEDDLVPEFTNCVSDVVVTANSQCQAIAEWSAPAVIDNCAGTISLESDFNSGDLFPLGNTTVTYTATDQAGNSSSCSFKVIVEDNTAPEIITQINDVVVSANDGCQAVANWNEIFAEDNCDNAVNLSSNFNSGDFFPLGESTVEITATDDAGNETTSSFTVTVEDSTSPLVVSCPNDIILSTTDNCEAVATWTLPVFSDNCDTNPIISSSHNSGDVFPLGTTRVTYTATDDAGNESICTFNVIVEDDLVPEFTNCVSDVVVTATSQCQAIAEWSAPAVTDNCAGTISLESDFNSGDLFPLGNTTVTYTATDQAGNSSSCSFKVIVEDNTAPEIITQINDVIVSANDGCQAVVNWNEIFAEDNCDNAVNLSSNFNSGDFFPLGESTVEITARDDAGNETTSSFTVTVEDSTSPLVVSCPNDIILSTTDNCEAVATWTLPVFSDNCDTNPIISSSHNSGDVFPLGTTRVTYTATDDAGNESICTFNVIVEDDLVPEFTNCVSDVVVTATSQCQAIAEWSAPAVTDNCAGTISLESDFNSGDLFPLGNTTVTYTATDQAGNSSSCSFEIIVEDNTAPLVSFCPAKQSIIANDNCIGIAEWDAPIFEDCSNLTITSNFQPGDDLPLGSSLIEYTATDLNGATAICTFEIEVVDETPPEVVDCPQDISMSASNNCESVVEWNAPAAADNCSGITISSNYESGSIFPVGITTVEYEFTDESGNKSFCSFEVNILDDSEILVSNCPEGITLNSENNDGTAIVDWEEPIATTECSEISVNSSHNPGSTFNLGKTTVTYTFIKENGQTETCSFEVNVEPIVFNVEINRLMTPNGDGNNDFWKIEGIEQFPDNRVVIIDRWGTEIYAATGYNNNEIVWSGETRGGVLVPRGTYYYFISIRNEKDVIERKGFLEILR